MLRHSHHASSNSASSTGGYSKTLGENWPKVRDLEHEDTTTVWRQLCHPRSPDSHHIWRCHLKTEALAVYGARIRRHNSNPAELAPSCYMSVFASRRCRAVPPPFNRPVQSSAYGRQLNIICEWLAGVICRYPDAYSDGHSCSTSIDSRSKIYIDRTP